ncbi:hypothetical protein EDD85DRAFT_951744 [Armillaria nabsnona]|nr:hypothetical protein EDD85DRAFT_951744 [Armillaria nabsnona]
MPRAATALPPITTTWTAYRMHTASTSSFESPPRQRRAGDTGLLDHPLPLPHRLGQTFKYLIHPSKKFQGRIPASSDPPSRDEPKKELKEARKPVKKQSISLLSETGFASVVYAVCTHCARSTYLNEDTSNEELTSVLETFKSFGYVIEQLTSTKVHSLFSAMTTEHNVHG